MAERNPANKSPRRSAKSTTGGESRGFTDEERSAMKERARELKTSARRSPRAAAADGDAAHIDGQPARRRQQAKKLRLVEPPEVIIKLR